MKKIFIICFCLISLSAHAQKKAEQAIYTLSGGKIEVYDSQSRSWKSKSRNSNISGSDYVRAENNFTLRNKKGFSETYGACDSIMVVKLQPARMVAEVIRGNDVITRDAVKATYVLDHYFLNVYPEKDWSFNIIIQTKEAGNLHYEVTSECPWIIIDNPEGTVGNKVKITGRIQLEDLPAGEKLDGICKVKCQDITSIVHFTVPE